MQGLASGCCLADSVASSRLCACNPGGATLPEKLPGSAARHGSFGLRCVTTGPRERALQTDPHDILRRDSTP